MKTPRHERPKNWGKRWSDDELRVVLSAAPTRENIIRFAAAFHRTEHAVEMVYRWAMRPLKEARYYAVTKGMGQFSLQVKRIAKEVGWV